MSALDRPEDSSLVDDKAEDRTEEAKRGLALATSLPGALYFHVASFLLCHEVTRLMCTSQIIHKSLTCGRGERMFWRSVCARLFPWKQASRLVSSAVSKSCVSGKTTSSDKEEELVSPDDVVKCFECTYHNTAKESSCTMCGAWLHRVTSDGGGGVSSAQHDATAVGLAEKKAGGGKRRLPKGRRKKLAQLQQKQRRVGFWRHEIAKVVSELKPQALRQWVLQRYVSRYNTRTIAEWLDTRGRGWTFSGQSIPEIWSVRRSTLFQQQSSGCPHPLNTIEEHIGPLEPNHDEGSAALRCGYCGHTLLLSLDMLRRFIQEAQESLLLDGGAAAWEVPIT